MQGLPGGVVSDFRPKEIPVCLVAFILCTPHEIPGGSSNIRSALDRLSAVLRTHPYSLDIEEVIYFLAIGQSALPTAEQTVASANGSLEYLDYLKEGYAPAHEGTPTVSSYPRWDLVETPGRDTPLLPPGGDSALSPGGGSALTPGDGSALPPEDGSTVPPTSGSALPPGGGSASGADRGLTGGLCVEGLPVWALQFQIGSLAFQLGESAQAMAAMESAFLSYETWLPRCLS